MRISVCLSQNLYLHTQRHTHIVLLHVFMCIYVLHICKIICVLYIHAIIRFFLNYKCNRCSLQRVSEQSCINIYIENSNITPFATYPHLSKTNDVDNLMYIIPYPFYVHNHIECILVFTEVFFFLPSFRLSYFLSPSLSFPLFHYSFLYFHVV